MNNPLVSIVIPVYNAEKYLERCLNTIINQTFQNIEIILVDDGSTDNSGSICDDYATKDGRFRVVHKSNEGVSSARQTGLDLAGGEYVIHADPDDWVEPNWIEELVKYALEKRADITMCGYYHEFQSASYREKTVPTSLEKDDVLCDLLYGRIWGALWNKLIRKECFDSFHVSFIRNMNLWEDLFVVTELVFKGATVSFLPIPLYHYDMFTNESSIVRKPNINHIYSMKIYIDKYEKLLIGDRFKEGFYERKLQLKKRCFRTGIKNKNLFVGLFPEFNNRFIAEHPFRWRDLRAYRGDINKMERVCMAIVLNGHAFIGYNLFDFWKKYAINSLRDIFK